MCPDTQPSHFRNKRKRKKRWFSFSSVGDLQSQENGFSTVAGGHRPCCGTRPLSEHLFHILGRRPTLGQLGAQFQSRRRRDWLGRSELRFQMLRLPVVLVILYPNIRAMSHVQDRIYYEGEDGFLSRHGLQPYLLRRLSGREAVSYTHLRAHETA